MSEPKDIEQLVEFRDQLLQWRNKAIWEWAEKHAFFTAKTGRYAIDFGDLKEFLEVGKESACQEP